MSDEGASGVHMTTSASRLPACACWTTLVSYVENGHPVHFTLIPVLAVKSCTTFRQAAISCCSQSSNVIRVIVVPSRSAADPEPPPELDLLPEEDPPPQPTSPAAAATPPASST